MFLFMVQSKAQVLISQSFDTNLGWTVAHPNGTSTLPGWTRLTTGTNPNCLPSSGAGMARFNSYDVAAGNKYSLTSPAITFTGALSKVKFKMYRDAAYPADADKIEVFYNTVASSVGGTLIGTVNRNLTLSPSVTAEGWYSYSFNLPAGTTGTGYVSFLASSFYGNNIFVDAISVNQTLANDAELTALNLNNIILAGTNTISGNITNGGSAVINTIDINWQADSGVINTQSLTGLSIAPGQSYSFTHANSWSPTAGQYSMHVWVSNTNGGDNDASNNDITRSVLVASNSTTRLPLYEKFTSSTCPPCATFDNTFGPFYASNNTNFALINYQVNWPGAGDPYYTAETGVRRAFYGVTAAPTMFIDSKDGTNFDTALLQSDLNNALSKPSYFLLNATKSLVGSDLTVNVTTTPYLTGTYRLFAAVVEKVTTGNASSNGETEFKNVMMKMMPNASGTVLNCVADTPITTNLSINLTGTFIEDLSDLEVVVFVQNFTSKDVMQSKFAADQLSNNQFSNISKIKLYPNPSNGIVKIATEKSVNVTVMDISGKVVFNFENVSNENNLDLSSLQKGAYLIKMSNEIGSETQKLILK